MNEGSVRLTRKQRLVRKLGVNPPSSPLTKREKRGDFFAAEVTEVRRDAVDVAFATR